MLLPQFEKVIELAHAHHFHFGIEHNEPEFRLFSSPKQCQKMLEAVNGLTFVWDMNHTTIEDYVMYMKLLPRFGMLHISDTQLPEVNYHLPIGQGNIDFSSYFAVLTRGGFQGIGILEIGGLPKPGGYGRDTDEALINSLSRINDVIGEASYNS
jgi:sugar phosphate isomerase/epimerase